MDFIGIISAMINVIAQADQNQSALNWLAEKYEAGGIFMHPILACLVLGLAFSIERFWTLSRARVNTKDFIVKVRRALAEGGVEQAKE
ncbi:MAG TPA: hypothetical protein VKD08_06610, partial [Ignavibacteriaceae bacterium]|nr:hypothetical protein [Ignavibacteriaceae bacterium]